jgi:hypothetical protein
MLFEFERRTALTLGRLQSELPSTGDVGGKNAADDSFLVDMVPAFRPTRRPGAWCMVQSG